MVAAIDPLLTSSHQGRGNETTVLLSRNTVQVLVPFWFHSKVFHLLPKDRKRPLTTNSGFCFLGPHKEDINI